MREAALASSRPASPAVSAGPESGPPAPGPVAGVAVVVIGRNEAAHLEASLRSALASADRVVYVDSDSSDGSPAVAEGMGVEVVRVDPRAPMSAARARNEGFDHVERRWPGTEFVQFVDGDCELRTGWVATALLALRADPGVAFACGRLRERDRDASVLARLCDMEFNREPGETAACGGIFLARAEAFRAAGGFDPAVAAGEEPELCLRVRRGGARILRLDAEMAWHDAGMGGLGDWWRRSVRSGRAYAQAAAIHGGGAERFGVRECAGVLLWTLGVPIGAAAAILAAGAPGALLLALHPLQLVRIALGRRRPGESRADAWLYAAACMACKGPQLLGMTGFWMRGRVAPPAPVRGGASPAPGLRGTQ